MASMTNKSAVWQQCAGFIPTAPLCLMKGILHPLKREKAAFRLTIFNQM